MESRITSTTYVPLQPPYLIIQHRHLIGMQIGTLVVTQQLEGTSAMPFKIDTHSYPVVSYKNKSLIPTSQQLTDEFVMEGTVWNFVELRDVSTLCLTTSELSWADFVKIVWRDIARRDGTAAPNYEILEALLNLGAKVEAPVGQYVSHLCTAPSKMVQTRQGDVLALNVHYSDDIKEMAKQLRMQMARCSAELASGFGKSFHIKMKWVTDEEQLKPLADYLNDEINNRLLAVSRKFTLTVLEPYANDDEKK